MAAPAARTGPVHRPAHPHPPSAAAARLKHHPDPEKRKLFAAPDGATTRLRNRTWRIDPAGGARSCGEPRCRRDRRLSACRRRRVRVPWPEALRAEVERPGARKVFAVVSSSLKAAMPLEADLAARSANASLGSGTASAPIRRARTSRASRRGALCRCRPPVAVGGGSMVDEAEVAQLCLAHSVFAAEGFDALRGKRREGAAAVARVRVVAVPTTLSGAEFTAIAGVTNVARNVKEGYAHPDLASRAVVLDPRVTVHAQRHFGFRTAFARSITPWRICARSQSAACDAASLHAQRLLSRGLRPPRPIPATRCAARQHDRGMAFARRYATSVQRGRATPSAMCWRHRRRSSRLHLARDARACAALEQAVNAAARSSSAKHLATPMPKRPTWSRSLLPISACRGRCAT